MHDRPPDILRFPVVDPPSVRERAIGTLLLERFEGHHQVHRRVLLVGKVKNGIPGGQHRDHHRGDDPTVRSDHDLDREDVLVESDQARQVAPEVGHRFSDLLGDAGIHGATMVAC